MVSLKQIVKFLDEYLDIKSFNDSSWNGLQFEGKSEVKKILFAVDSGIETFELAVKEKADMILVHHGLFWEGQDPRIIGATKKRFDILFKNNISLYGCHLPIDKHKEAGNNGPLLKQLGAKITGEFGEYKGQLISWKGELKIPMRLKNMEKKLNEILNTKCKIIAFGKDKIKTIGTCSGGGAFCVHEAIEQDLDLLITGEQSDIYHTIKDNNMNVIFAGHHASETVGVKALSEIVKKKFNVHVTFLDIPTGL